MRRNAPAHLFRRLGRRGANRKTQPARPRQAEGAPRAARYNRPPSFRFPSCNARPPRAPLLRLSPGPLRSRPAPPHSRCLVPSYPPFRATARRPSCRRPPGPRRVPFPPKARAIPRARRHATDTAPGPMWSTTRSKWPRQVPILADAGPERPTAREGRAFTHAPPIARPPRPELRTGITGTHGTPRPCAVPIASVSRTCSGTSPGSSAMFPRIGGACHRACLVRCPRGLTQRPSGFAHRRIATACRDACRPRSDLRRSSRESESVAAPLSGFASWAGPPSPHAAGRQPAPVAVRENHGRGAGSRRAARAVLDRPRNPGRSEAVHRSATRIDRLCASTTAPSLTSILRITATVVAEAAQ